MGRAQCRPRERRSRLSVRLDQAARLPSLSFLSRAAALLAPLLLAAAVLVPGGEARAQTTVTLVSNTGYTINRNWGLVGTEAAQGFHTGGNVGGYDLASVDIWIGRFFSNHQDHPVIVTVTLHESTSAGLPGAEEYTFINPTLVRDSVNTFTAPADAVLKADTDYFLVVEQLASSVYNDFSLKVTETTTDDLGGAPGFIIADDRKWCDNRDVQPCSWVTHHSREVMQIGVNGSAVSGGVAPVFDDGATATLSVAENTPAGEDIGDPVAATDEDGDTLTYSLGGTDATSFTIDASSGQLQTAAALDHETQSSYAVTVKVAANDGTGGTAEIAVTVTVTDVAEQPATPAAPTVALNAPDPTESLAVSWTEPDRNGGPAITGYDLQYRQSDTQSWTDGPQGVTGTSATIESLTFSTSYDVQVRALNGETPSAWSASGTGITAPLAGSVCTRTAQVGNAIVAAALASSCGHVTDADLAAITSLNLSSRPVNTFTSLKAGDFSGLSSLNSLDLSSNQLSTLPDGIFAGLSSLGTLNLTRNQLTTLPGGVFAGLSSLTTLLLFRNRLTTLPAGVFAGLSSLTTLHLFGNQLTTLPAGVFAGLVNPPGTLTLGSNRVDPLPLSISLEKVGDSQFKAVAPAGVPFAVILPVSVSAGGTIDGGASAITIPVGAVESAPLGVTRAAGTVDAVTMDIGTLPARHAGHSGYELEKDSATLPLTVVAGDRANSPPAFDDGATAGRSVAENTAAGEDIGDPVAASDADNDTLAYSLGGTDAASFAIVTTSGQLQTAAALDHETKPSYSVIVTAVDGNGGTDTIAVTVTVIDVAEPGAPTGLTATASGSSADSGDTVVTLSWTAPADTGGAAITGYRVEHSLTGTGAWRNRSADTGTAATTFTHAGVNSGSTRHYRVSAINSEGAGDPSAIVAATTAPAPAVVVREVEVPPDWPLAPSGVGDGDRFRLLFVTSLLEFTAISDRISDYDTIVQGKAAAGHADIRAYSGDFRVLASTPGVNGRVHTGTTGSGQGIAIYWLNGARIADSYADFYDGSVTGASPREEDGSSPSVAAATFTGSNNDGTTAEFANGDSKALGAATVVLGDPRQGNGFLSASQVAANTTNIRLYGLSPVFRVVAPPGVTVSETSLTVAERFNDGAPESATYTLVLDAAPSGPVTVRIAASVERAVSVDPSPVTFSTSDWNEPRTVTVTAINDDGDTEDAEVVLSHTAAGGGYDGVVIDDVAVTALDDDARSEIAFERAALDVLENAFAAEFTVVAVTDRNRPPGQEELWIVLASRPGSGPDGASTEDFQAVDAYTKFRRVDFVPWMTPDGDPVYRATLSAGTVLVTDDNEDEDNETFTVELQRTALLNSLHTFGEPDVLTVTIVDDDGRINHPPTGLPTITGTPQVFLTLNADVSGIEDENGLGLFAYQWIRGEDTDIPDATKRSYDPVEADVGHTLKVRVTFSDGDNNRHMLTSEPTAPVAAPLEVSIATAHTAASPVVEGAGAQATFTLARTVATTDAQTVLVEVSERKGTSFLAATAGQVRVRFAAESTTATLSVPIEDDTVKEFAGGAVIAALAPGNGYKVSATAGSAEAAVIDDDALLEIAFDDVAPRRVGEGDGSIAIAYTARSAVGGVAVALDAGALSVRTRQGTATPGADYTAVSDAIGYVVGDFSEVSDSGGGTRWQARRTVDVAIAGDSFDENDEQFTVEFETGSPFAGSALVLGKRSVPIAVTVEDDDDRPALTLSATPAAISEAGTVTVSTVEVASTNGSAFPEDQTIALTLTGTATAGDDYAVASEGAALTAPYELTLAAGTTGIAATVTAVNDRVTEGDETVVITAALDGDDIGTQQITITEVPAMLSITGLADATAPENSAWAATPTLEGTPVQSVTWTLEGDDAGDFTIEATGGALSMVARDYEDPQDADAGNDYQVTVKAADSAIPPNMATASLTVTVTDVAEAAGTPDAPAVAQDATDPTGSLAVSWDAPDRNGGPEITGYDLRYRESDTETWEDGPLGVNDKSTTIGSLEAGTSYDVQVRALNGETPSGWSASGTASTSALTAPAGAPTGLTATASGSSADSGDTVVTLSWTAPAETGGAAITGYQVEHSLTGTGAWRNRSADTGTTATTFTHSGVNSGSTRYYRVSAINSKGAGDPSAIVEATTAPAPAVQIREVEVAGRWPLAPSGLGVGDRFRLLFVTSQTSFQATSGRLSDYDAIVQNSAAAGHADIRAYSGDFRVLASTGGVNGRVNTGTTGSGQGISIYWLNGARIADSYADFYDGSVSTSRDARRNQAGNQLGGSLNSVFTGLNNDGTTAEFANGNSKALGASTVRAGRPWEARTFFSSEEFLVSNTSKPLYGLSPVFRVVATPGVTLSETSLTVAERFNDDAPESATYTVVLDEAPSDSVTVRIAASVERAVSVDPSPLTFSTSDWNEPRTVTVTAINDDGDTEDAAVVLSHTAAGGGYAGVVIDDVAVTALDDDARSEIAFERAALDVLENADSAEFTVVAVTDRERPPGVQNLWINLASTPGSGPGGASTEDFQRLNAVGKFGRDDFERWTTPDGDPVYRATLTAAVPINDDTDEEGNETFTVGLQRHALLNSLNTIGEPDVLTVTILDNDGVVNFPPTGLPTITGTPQEGRTLTADLSGIDDENVLPPISPFFFSYQWIRGEDTDISGATRETYSPVEADVGHTLKVRVTFSDGDNFRHTLTSEPTAAVVAAAKVSIATAHTAASPVVEGAGAQATFTLARTGATTESLTVDVDVSDRKGTSFLSATAPQASVQFAADSTTATLSVPIEDDTVKEFAGGAVIAAVAPGNGYTVSATAGSAEAAVIDDDALLEIAFDDVAPRRVGEGDGSIAIAYTARSAVGGVAVAVDAGALSVRTRQGTATPGADYTAVSDAIGYVVGDFSEVSDSGGGTRWQARRTVDVAIAGDSFDENDEQFTVEFETGAPFAGSALVLGKRSVPIAVTVEDDDDAPALTLSATPAAIAEAGNVTVSTVEVAITNGSAFPEDQTIALTLTGTATAGDDYAVASDGAALTAPYELTLAAGTTGIAATVTAVNDAVTEGDETVVITAALNGNDIGTQQITITDVITLPVVQFHVDDVTLTETEQDGWLTIRVTLSPASTEAVTVRYINSPTGDTPARGCPQSLSFAQCRADGAYDYRSSNPDGYELTFRVGETQSSASFYLFDDTADEPDETFKFTLANPSGATLGPRSVSTITIQDDDASNTPPAFDGGDTVARSVAENTAAGEDIGDPVGASDADNDTLTYTLGGTDSASFAIVTTSGQLQTAAALDYETKSSYAVQVTADDGNGGTDTIAVTIAVTNVTESPTVPNASTSLTAMGGDTTVEPVVDGAGRRRQRGHHGVQDRACAPDRHERRLAHGGEQHRQRGHQLHRFPCEFRHHALLSGAGDQLGRRRPAVGCGGSQHAAAGAADDANRRGSGRLAAETGRSGCGRPLPAAVHLRPEYFAQQRRPPNRGLRRPGPRICPGWS